MPLADLDVLIVDDHEAMRAMLARALGAAGVQHVRAAADAPSALGQLRQRRADLILADHNMPGEDGLSLIAAVRGDAKLRGARIIMISGHADAGHAEAARSAGADAVLVKPVSPRELMSTIAALF
jgi:two-component system chemotaxis response regulator CheY